MLTKMRNKLHMPWGRGKIPSIAGLPKLLSSAELTRLSWAIRIESYADVPDIYKSFFKPFLKSEKGFPYTVLTPSHERFIHKQSESLISTFGHEIYVLEKNGSTFETQCYPIDGISYVEFKTALLASSFKICGMTSQEVHTSSTLIFNSITDYLFKPYLKKARLVAIDTENSAKTLESEKFDHLAYVNYKFMNFAKNSLLGGEKVLYSILQPEIKDVFLTFLRKTFYRTISPTHMSILTNRELITIQEEVVRETQNRYGGIWDYIPLNKIISLSVSERTGDLLVLTVQLPEDTSFEILFQASAKEELNQLLDRFKEFIVI
jgi:hypothetical protein